MKIESVSESLCFSRCWISLSRELENRVQNREKDLFIFVFMSMWRHEIELQWIRFHHLCLHVNVKTQDTGFELKWMQLRRILCQSSKHIHTHGLSQPLPRSLNQWIMHYKYITSLPPSIHASRMPLSYISIHEKMHTWKSWSYLL